MRDKTEISNITEDEAALYDRQIRLWGLDAQRRLRASRVLLIGVSGLGAEVAKNIILAGIKSITLLDHAAVSEEDRCYQFLVSRDDLGKNRAESSVMRAAQLNPMVEVSADTDNISEKTDEFFLNFDIVCATCCSSTDLLRINDLCRTHKIQFYAGDVFGYYGYMFADLGQHEYAEEVVKKEEKEEGTGEPAAKKVKVDTQTTVTVKKKIEYCSLKSALEVKWGSAELKKAIRRTPCTYFIMKILLEFRQKFQRDPDTQHVTEDKAAIQALRSEVMEKDEVEVDKVPDNFSQFCFAELAPVCAVVGGVLGQEIIKAVSQKDQPHNNFFFFNGIEGSGMVDCIGN